MALYKAKGKSWEDIDSAVAFGELVPVEEPDWDALHDKLWLMWQDPMASAADAVEIVKAALGIGNESPFGGEQK